VIVNILSCGFGSSLLSHFSLFPFKNQEDDDDDKAGGRRRKGKEKQKQCFRFSPSPPLLA